MVAALLALVLLGVLGAALGATLGVVAGDLPVGGRVAVPGGLEAASLVRRALARQGADFRVLAARLVPVIRARVRRRLAAYGRTGIGAHEPDDLTQEIWLTLLDDGGRQLLAYDPHRGMTLEGYVGRIAEREVHNRLVAARAAKRGGDRTEVATDTLPEVPSAAGDPESQIAAQNLAASLSAHLEATLPERGRAILRFLYTDGRSVEEIARVLGIQPQVVYNWQHRIRGAAAAYLATATA